MGIAFGDADGTADSAGFSNHIGKTIAGSQPFAMEAAADFLFAVFDR